MSRLLVPVHLDVLLVRQSGGRFADCAMAEPTVEDQRHRDLFKPPFSERSAGRARGAYLHWALPDALTRGVAQADGAVSFNAVPDRWLVTRLSPSTTPGRRAVRGWVLEADRGIVHPLDGWAESGQPPAGHAPLTALGHGDPAWAAYFDNAVNRLAFYDDLADVAAGPIAYLVSGWHAAAVQDPLADPTLGTKVAVHDRLAEMAWTLAGPGAKAPENKRPQGTLYHGAVVDLAWPSANPASPEVGGPPPATGMRVVLGSTTCEALASLLASSDAEVRLLEASHLGVLDELAEPDGHARLDAILHASGFGSIPGGEVTEQIEQPQTPVEPTPPLPTPSGFPVSLPESAVASVFRARPAPEISPRAFVLPDRVREVEVVPGRLVDVVRTLPVGEEPPPPTGLVEVQRALPRLFHPTDPVILIQGARRSFRHGGDGRFTREGLLACRAGEDTVRELTVLDPRTPGATARLAVGGGALLERGIGNPAVPTECESLLRELVLLDPGAGTAVSRALQPSTPAPADDPVLRRRIAVEQTVWWATRDLRVDPGDLFAQSGLDGTLPSPVAVTPATVPWTPLHLEWRVEYVPSAAGARDWRLGEVDFEPAVAGESETPPTAAPVTLEGRSLLTPAAADIAAGTTRRTFRKARSVGNAAPLPPGAIARFASDVAAALDAHIGGLTAAADDGGLDLVTALGEMDVLSGALDPLHAELRGGVAFDEPEPVHAAREPNFPLRAGFLRLRRLRIVDGFGQFVDVLGGGSPDAPVPGAASIELAETMRVEGAPDLAALAPRLTAPARVWLRYSDGEGRDRFADARTSPVAGYLLPNHLDAALEIFDAAGVSRGALRPGSDGGLVFEAAPGIATTLGRSATEALGNAALAGIVEGLLDWGLADAAAGPEQRPEGVLDALLRLIDASRWAVDPQGHGVDEALGPLVGRPVAVLEARAWLEVAEEDAARLASTELPLRLGSVASLQDGLYGVFVGRDYRSLAVAGAAAGLAREVGPGRGYLQQAPLVGAFHQHLADDVEASGSAEGGSPVVHPYMVRDRLIPLVPGREVKLTLLAEPYGLVHATTGVLPRKEIGMRREWLAPGLARMAPTFRFGPVLVDPKQVRLPLAREAAGDWSWAHRLDETTWAEEPVVDAASQTAAVGTAATASEGWLRFSPSDDDSEEESR